MAMTTPVTMATTAVAVVARVTSAGSLS
jgi:hypothetical protein